MNPSTPSSNSTLSEDDYRHLADFRFELREFLHFSEAAAYAAGIHPQQHQALLTIRGSQTPDAVTVGELALRLKIKPHTALELVNRMVADDLLVTASDPGDGRRVLLRLTRHSERLLRKLSSAHKTELARIGPALKEILTHLQILP
jgi:DNA-binding MarR family transcriptional regulator